MRRATIRTDLPNAALVAASVVPDHTPQMETRVDVRESGDDSRAHRNSESSGDDGTITTTIERGTTGGLRATIDDYVVNLTVATTVSDRGIDFTNDRPTHDHNE